MDNLTPQTGLSAKKVFSRIGWALLAIAVCATVLQFLMSFLMGWAETKYPALLEMDWLLWAVTFAPIYLAAMPLGIGLLKRLPASPAPVSRLTFRQFSSLMLMCFPVMYGGNLIGTALSLILSGGTAENILLDYVMGNPLYSFLFTVILAPVFEEFVFRKLIVDRCIGFGERTAVMFSGLVFGLFHMNLFQFFYAFWLGMLFAHVYARTGNIRYSIIMHMVINFLGSVVAPWFLTNLDLDAMLSGSSQDLTSVMEQLPMFAGYMLYSALLMIAIAAGLVLLIIRWRTWKKASLTKDAAACVSIRTVWLNPGMILFCLFCILMTGANLFLS